MKRIAVIVLAVTAMWGCTPKFESQVRRAVERQTADYPVSRLQDLYKSFFQDYFGAGHLIADRAQAIAFIERELSAVDPAGAIVIEPAGAEGRFVRIELTAVVQGIITAEELADAMIASTEGFSPPTLDEWQREWTRIERIIDSMELEIEEYEVDREALAAHLAEGLYVCHHSATYNAACRRHYRIVRRDIFLDRFADRLD